MAGFSNFKDYQTKVIDGGQYHYSTFRKITPVATTANVLYDMSYGTTGHPVSNFYASSPLVAAKLEGREGIQHGQAVAPAKKYLKRINAACTVALTNLFILDYLMYYPFIDGDSTDEQLFVNYGEDSPPVAVALPRSITGEGVLPFLVAQGTYVGGVRFRIMYTNSDGVSGRLSEFININTSTFAGAVASSGAIAGSRGWALPLQLGDRGVRSVQSITFEAAAGGIFALVLAKQIGTLTIREASIPVEKDFLIETGFNMPQIDDGAYLHFLALPAASLAAAPIYGSLQTVWG